MWQDKWWHLDEPEPTVVLLDDAHAAWSFQVCRLLAVEFPRWTIWQSDAGCWWATRRPELTKSEDEAGLSRTLDGDSPEKLAAALHEQAEKP
ncbi:hypothetical protein ACWDR1_26375 [Streptosporangium sandarakinum]